MCDVDDGYYLDSFGLCADGCPPGFYADKEKK